MDVSAQLIAWRVDYVDAVAATGGDDRGVTEDPLGHALIDDGCLLNGKVDLGDYLSAQGNSNCPVGADAEAVRGGGGPGEGPAAATIALVPVHKRRARAHGTTCAHAQLLVRSERCKCNVEFSLCDPGYT